MRKESTLYAMLIEDLGEATASRFLKGYGERSNVMYSEAYIAARDGSVYGDFVPYYEGQLLYYLHQTMFINLAADCGLPWRIQRCEQNGFPTVVVNIGRFHFTNHHGTSPYEITCLNPSLMRAQNSHVNMSLLQGHLWESPFDGRKLRQADDIYGNFIHGCRGTGKTFATDGFMQIAFPCATDVKNVEEAQKKLRYVERFDLYRVLDSVIARENENRRAASPQLRVVAPKIKKQQQ